MQPLPLYIISSMVRSNSTTTSDQMKVKSSISLLQDRFKHLQKMKKKRQEKELLKNMLMHFDQNHDVELYNNNIKFYFHSELNLNNILWPDINYVRSTPELKCHNDVDTSLHL